MADLTEIQSSGSTKIAGANAGGVEDNFVEVTSAQALKVDGSAVTHPVSFAAIVSAANSTSTPLAGNASFSGAFEDVLLYENVSIIVFANQTGTLNILWSSDGTNTDDSDSFSVPASNGKQYSFGRMSQYARVTFVNDSSAQSTFRLQTIYHKGAFKYSSHRAGSSIIDDDDTELMKAVLTGKDATNTYHNVATDSFGNLITTSPNFNSGSFSFGDVTTSATTLASARRTTYTEQTTNAQRSVSSSSANDTSAGTGARTIKLTYYDQTCAGPFTETITMNGTANVNTVSSTICFVEKIEVLTIGSTASNVGIITLHAATAGGGAVIGTIAATDNETFWAHHYVPTGKLCSITGFSVGHTGTTVGSGARFFLKSHDPTSSVLIEKQVSDFVRLYGQSSTITRNYASPIKLTGPARIVAYLLPETATSTTYISSFDFFEE